MEAVALTTTQLIVVALIATLGPLLVNVFVFRGALRDDHRRRPIPAHRLLQIVRPLFVSTLLMIVLAFVGWQAFKPAAKDNRPQLVKNAERSTKVHEAEAKRDEAKLRQEHAEAASDLLRRLH